MSTQSVKLLSVDDIFSENISWELGQRLGVSYMQAQQEEINVYVGDRVIPLEQCSLGVLAITGVIWDAGLYMVDFLSWLCQTNTNQLQCDDALLQSIFFDSFPLKLGRTIDLGCGTGIVGVAATALNATDIVFSDYRCCCNDNLTMDELTEDERSRCRFVEYDWNKPVPNELLSDRMNDTKEDQPIVWDTILCSDVVYDNKALEPLIQCLTKLSFKRLIISYKRRHDDQEHEFFNQLSTFCHVRAIAPSDIPLKNLKPTSLVGLYMIIAIKKDM